MLRDFYVEISAVAWKIGRWTISFWGSTTLRFSTYWKSFENWKNPRNWESKRPKFPWSSSFCWLNSINGQSRPIDFLWKTLRNWELKEIYQKETNPTLFWHKLNWFFTKRWRIFSKFTRRFYHKAILGWK